MPQITGPVSVGGAITCMTLIAGNVLAVASAYQGACDAGSGPGGWNIHMVFVMPFVIVVGLGCAVIAILLAAAMPLAIWLRVTMFFVIAALAAYFVTFGLLTAASRKHASPPSTHQ